MIQPDRLEKIIKYNIPFWYIEDNQVRETHQAKYWKIAENKIVWYADNDLYRTFETIFETKEDAEWALEFGNITREEKLSLPTFEEITTNDKYNYYGISYFGFNDYTLMVKLPSEEDDREFIRIYKNRVNEEGCWEEATKENYIEACRLCKKLFLGETR